MNYKKETVEMLNKIQSEKVLRYIWIFVSDAKILELKQTNSRTTL